MLNSTLSLFPIPEKIDQNFEDCAVISISERKSVRTSQINQFDKKLEEWGLFKVDGKYPELRLRDGKEYFEIFSFINNADFTHLIFFANFIHRGEEADFLYCDDLGGDVLGNRATFSQMQEKVEELIMIYGPKNKDKSQFKVKILNISDQYSLVGNCKLRKSDLRSFWGKFFSSSADVQWLDLAPSRWID